MGEKEWKTYNTLDFNFLTPENPDAILGRLIKLLFTTSPLWSAKDMITFHMIVKAKNAGNFRKSGRYLFIVHRRLTWFGYKFKYQLIFNT